MHAPTSIVLSSFAALLILAADATAGGISIGFQKQGKSSSIGVQIGFPVYAPRPAPPVYGGRWETVVERVWVPGRTERVWVAPVYETRYDACGRPIQVCVRAGWWSTVQHPGHWEERRTKVWRNGHGGRHGRDRWDCDD
ncbi:MAG: hypothetical protein JNK02_01755 [Planctomycetes bacterium]|nr:hypothetical protein [Planctomycetota bacterium]